MQMTQTFASKALVAVVAAAMIFSAFVAPAKAATAEELQKMINDLMAQMAALQGQGGTSGSVASGVCPFTWTRDLKTGTTGADVMKLQQFLNANADTRVAASGAGSVGAETEYFGPATAAAVSKFQVMHRADILTPSGLTNPTGFFGPSTRAKANALCVAGGSTTTPGGDDDNTNSGDLSGEADLDSVELDDADDNTVEEGAEEAEIGVINVEFTNGDAEITRLDLKLDGGGTPWQAFDAISLWVDGDMVAEVDASSKSDYLSSSAGTLRFSGLDIVAMEDEVLEITVAATIKSTVRNLSANDEWDLSVASLRYADADGVVSTENATNGGVVDTNEKAEFTIEAEGTNDDAEIKKSSANPDATTLQVEDNSSRSDEYTVLAFNIEIDEESADTELGMAYATVTVANNTTVGSTFAKIVDTVKMTIEGKTVTGKVSHGSTAAQNGSVGYEFDFKGLELAADDTYEAVLALTFKGQNGGSNYANGVTISASVASNGTASGSWELESMKTGDYILSGTQSSKTHTLATVVPVISNVTSSVDRNEAGDAGTISFDFKVEADTDDVEFDLADIVRTITGGSAATTTSLTKVSGDADWDGVNSVWTVSEGDEATFSLDITFTAATSTQNGAYRVTLDTIAGVKVDKTSSALNLTK